MFPLMKNTLILPELFIFDDKTFCFNEGIRKRNKKQAISGGETLMNHAIESKSTLVDEMHGLSLSHIWLVCNMISAKCTCTKCKNIPIDVIMGRVISPGKSKPSQTNIEFHLCGSYAETCQIPPFFVEDNVSKVRKLNHSDINFMAYANHDELLIGFDEEKDRNIEAVIETRHTKPGYLRLRTVNGDHVRNSRLQCQSDEAKEFISDVRITCLHLRHKPTIINKSEGSIIRNLICDVVSYWRCPIPCGHPKQDLGFHETDLPAGRMRKL